MNENLNYDVYIYKEYNIIKENEVYNLRLEFDQINIKFKLKNLNESIDYIYKNKYKIAFFINKLEVNPNKFSNYEIVINTFDKLYNKNNILIDKINDDNIIIKIKYDNNEKEIQLNKEYMNINDKFNIMYNQLKFINNFNDKMEIEKMKKEIKELNVKLEKNEKYNDINEKDNIIDEIINKKIDKIIKSYNTEFKDKDKKIMELNKKLINQEKEMKNKNKEIELINNKLEKIRIELNDYQRKNNNINGIKIKKNNDYEKKINYKFIKDPQKLKYKYDIINTNITYGFGDIFEIFISYKDNKEYIISPNITNNNLDIFSLFHTEEIEDLFYEIKQDLHKADKKGKGALSEKELLEYFQSKLPPNKKLNMPIFKHFLQNIGKNKDMNIDLNDFCQKFFQNYEERKSDIKTLSKVINKEKKLKNELEKELNELKKILNKEDINPNFYISTGIGKIKFSNKNNTDKIYCKVNLDGSDEKRIEIKNIKEEDYTEKLYFIFEDIPSNLSYKFYSSKTNQFIGVTEVPLYNIKTENEEVSQEFEIQGDSNEKIGELRLKITIVTSYKDLYQNQYNKYKNLDENIESNQRKIDQLNGSLNELILPYKSEFEKYNKILLKGSKIMKNDGELLYNKKIISLQGHNNTIRTIRYFMNIKNKKEYLISADKNKTVIIWDITNNYNILYNINTNYGDDIYSCLLIFSNNDNNNYIITSTKNNSNDIDKSSSKIYSLNDGQFIKYINNSNNYRIYYLLSWDNDNKDYIIEFANNKIIINNLLEDKLYSELIQEPEENHYSGFIKNKDNIDYLYSSSNNGYINIWNLNNKQIFKVINTNKCKLNNIIEWNDKFIIVADFENKSFIIINKEISKVICEIKGVHKKGVKSIKKIYHPIYGESLLSSDQDRIIKIWSI